MAESTADQQKFMRLALSLAQRGRGKVEPNPMVGAVIVRRGRIIGQGYHRRFGVPHAEVDALANCRGRPADASMYVTLEPCCHHAKTPPCTGALISARLAEVVVATKDPSAKVNGKGIGRLRRAGIKVAVGTAGAQARRLNAAFFKLQRQGRPLVTLKWAQSLDGKIASTSGQSRWISNDQSRRMVHRLRRNSQAILVGIGTALADDPLLTARPSSPGQTLLRIVVDSRMRLPLKSQLVRTVEQAPLLIATTALALKRRPRVAERLIKAGVELLAVNRGPGRVDLGKLLDQLGRREISNLLVEGGSAILGQFIACRLADRVVAFICPKIIGGKNAPGPIGGLGASDLAQALRLNNLKTRRIADDVLIQADLPIPNDYLYG